MVPSACENGNAQSLLFVAAEEVEAIREYVEVPTANAVTSVGLAKESSLIQECFQHYFSIVSLLVPETSSDGFRVQNNGMQRFITPPSLPGDFVPPRDQDAWATIRGFIYQVEVTIKRWLELRPGQVLELERGEDIDLIANSLQLPPDGRDRVLEQVKYREANVSLRSSAVRASLAHLLEHQRANPALSIGLRYTTNAEVTHEMGSSIPRSVPGISVWKQVRDGTWAGDENLVLDSIRELLQSGLRPDGVRDEVWQAYQEWVTGCSPREFRSFMNAVEWSTGEADATSLTGEIRLLLSAQGYVEDEQEADEVYRRLFLFVCKLLSRPGLKQLTVESRAEQLTATIVTESDRRLLSTITSLLHAVDVRVTSLEHHVGQLDVTVADHQTRIEALTLRSGNGATAQRQHQRLFVGVPVMPPTFIGREETLNELVGRILSGSTVAITGKPGVGKTTIAVALAYDSQLLSHFTNGILWAGLGPHPDVMGALGGWAEALGIDVSREAIPAKRARAVKNSLGHQQMLIIIDDAWDSESAELLRCGGPNCVHVLTSRDQSIARRFASPVHVTTIREFAEDVAFELLCSLAPEICSAHPATTRDLVRTVGGLPLSIDVVGGYLGSEDMRYFPEMSAAAVTELTDALRRRHLAAVRLGSAEATTLEQIISLSLERLPAAAVRAFYALGAFAPNPDEFDLGAATYVTGADTSLIGILLGRHLLDQAGNGRLSLHQSISDIASTRVDSVTLERHRAYYLDAIAGDATNWKRIAECYGQIRWAWRRLPDYDIRLAGYVTAIERYQYLQGLWLDHIAWAERALNSTNAASAPEIRLSRAKLLNNLGLVHGGFGEFETALERLGEARLIQEELDDAGGLATTLNNIGFVHSKEGRYRESLRHYQRALPLRSKADDRAGYGTTLNNIGVIYSKLGEYSESLRCYEEAVKVREEVGDRVGLATSLNNIGLVYGKQKRWDSAIRYYQEALPIRSEVGDRAGYGSTIHNLGLAYAGLEEFDNALACYEEARKIFEELGDRVGLLNTLNAMANLHSLRGAPAAAANLLEQVLPMTQDPHLPASERLTRLNLARAYRSLSRFNEAISQLVRVVMLDEQLEHPELQDDKALLDEVQGIGLSG